MGAIGEWVFFYPQKVVWLLKPISILLPEARKITTICLGTHNNHRHKSCPLTPHTVKLSLITVSLAFTSSSFPRMQKYESPFYTTRYCTLKCFKIIFNCITYLKRFTIELLTWALEGIIQPMFYLLSGNCLTHHTIFTLLILTHHRFHHQSALRTV